MNSGAPRADLNLNVAFSINLLQSQADCGPTRMCARFLPRELTLAFHPRPLIRVTSRSFCGVPSWREEIEDEFTIKFQYLRHQFRKFANGQIFACANVDKGRLIGVQSAIRKFVPASSAGGSSLGKVIAVQEFAARPTSAPDESLFCPDASPQQPCASTPVEHENPVSQNYLRARKDSSALRPDSESHTDGCRTSTSQFPAILAKA